MEPALAPAPQLVWFRGKDAVKFLNDLISQEIGTLQPGTVARSLLLEPQGKLDFVLWVLVGEDEVGLITEDGRGDELVARLSRYRIRVDVDIQPETGVGYLVVGDGSVDAGSWARQDGVLVADLSWPNVRRELRVGGHRPELPEAAEDELTAARIESGFPIVGLDLDEKTIPQEAGLVGETVSFDKGCFLGQELVARLDSRGGRVNRHLRLIEFDSPVVPGAPMSAGDREVGTVGSASGKTAMALLWREVGPGDEVVSGDATGVVREIPQKTAGSFTTS